jgi:hypothetical protein
LGAKDVEWITGQVCLFFISGRLESKQANLGPIAVRQDNLVLGSNGRELFARLPYVFTLLFSRHLIAAL